MATVVLPLQNNVTVNIVNLFTLLLVVFVVFVVCGALISL